MVQYSVVVKPGSSREEAVEAAAAKDGVPGELTVYLRARPHDGEANVALIKLLAKHFKVPKTSIRIIRGQRSKNKTIEF